MGLTVNEEKLGKKIMKKNWKKSNTADIYSQI